MYAEFAELYDRLTDDFDYDAWASYYLDLVSSSGEAPARLLECGCGTGSVAVRLAGRVKTVVGCDISPEMLAVAQRKARIRGVAVQFVRQDMRRIELPHPADAIIAPCDGVNYLLSQDDLSAFFESAQRNLRPGGILAFDFSTEKKLNDMLDRELFYEDRGEVTYIWRNVPGEGERVVDMRLVFFVRQPGGAYRRFDERQIQKAHRLKDVTALLERAGFRDIAAYGDMTKDAPSPCAERIHIAAKRT